MTAKSKAYQFSNLESSKLFVVCGLQGSGKTTYATQLAKDIGAKSYEVDEFYSTHKHLSYSEITELLHANIQTDLLNCKNVVLDGTYVTEFVRLKLLNSLADVPCRKTIVVMNTPLEECLQINANREHRVPDHAVATFAKMYQHPTLEEGWDEIITVQSTK